MLNLDHSENDDEFHFYDKKLKTYKYKIKLCNVNSFKGIYNLKHTDEYNGITTYYNTLENIERDLIKHFELNVDENQSYLTEPFDPEFEFYYVGSFDGIDEHKKRILSMLDMFCKNNKLILTIKNNNIKINNSGSSIIFDICPGSYPRIDFKFHEKYFTDEVEGTLLMDTEDEDGWIVIDNFEQLEEEINNYLN